MENEWHLRQVLVPFYFKIKYGPHRAEQTIQELCLIARRGSTRLVHFTKIFMFIAFHCLMCNTKIKEKRIAPVQLHSVTQEE